MKNNSPLSLFLFPVLVLILLSSCTFDYGEQGGGDLGLPDIIMENVEYVRVRSAEPQARFLAERVERFEDRRIMELVNFSFEQFASRTEEVNAQGSAGSGFVDMESNDVRMYNAVRIEVETEDITIETTWLQWRDRDRVLYGGPWEEVTIRQQDGTNFTGIGFRANARKHTWEFSGAVSGIFIHEDDEDEDEDVYEEDSGG